LFLFPFSRATPVVFISIFLSVVAFQWAAGAYTADFAGNPDEPSQVVSSLLVYDYLVDGFPKQPLRFAEDYYVHYPEVAIGHWPPMFYAVEGAGMLFCSVPIISGTW
jgi:hypothetical protein